MNDYFLPMFYLCVQQNNCNQNWKLILPNFRQCSKAELMQLNTTQFICWINFSNKKVGNRKN